MPALRALQRSLEYALAFARTRPIVLALVVVALIVGSVGTSVILANTPAILSVVQTTPQIIEGDSLALSVAEFQVRLSESVTAPVTVTVSTGVSPTNPATAGTDYTANSQVLVFSPGQIVKTFQVQIIGDDVDELNEAFRVTLSNLTTSADVTIDNASITAIIFDDDSPSVASISDPTANEGAGTIGFVVTLSATSPQNTSIAYTTQDGPIIAANGATSPADYTGTTDGELVIPAGATTGTISIPLVDDALDEPDEDFRVTLVPVDSTNVEAFADTTAVGTIIDNDTPIVTFSAAALSVDEGVGTANITATLNITPAQQVTVDYVVTGGTATGGGTDYSLPGAQTLTFAAGSTTATIPVTVVDDAVDEADETVAFQLQNATNATIGTPSASTLTIVDNDAAPTITIDDVSVAENAGSAVFAVDLSAASSLTVTVQYATVNGSATAPGDYTAASGTLTFAPGTTTQPITVTVTDDALFEGDETFVVNLSAATNATISDAQGVGTITDDDTAPTVSIGDTSVTEGDTGTVNASFPVTLSAASALTVTVDYATVDGSAMDPADYTNTTGTVTFTPGVTQTTVTVPVVGDTLFEGDETFVVNLSNELNATLGDAQGTGTIIDDDVLPGITISDVVVAENAGPAVFTVELTATSAATITVDYTTTDGSATAGSDYTAANGTLTFAPGTTTQPITVTVTDDADYEGDETFTVTLSNAQDSNANPLTVTGSPATGTITDDDQPTVAFTAASASVAEDVGTTTATVELSAAVIAGDTITVPFTLGGTATEGSDYTTIASPLVFTAGEISKSITVTVTDDALDEDDETVVLTLGTPTGATLGTTSVYSLTITDNDDAPTVSIGDAPTVNEGASGTTVAATFPVTLSVASGRPITVTYTTVNDTATAGSDYTTSSGTVSFAPGQTTQNITVTVLGDDVYEGAASEQFFVDLSAPANATLGDAQGIGTIAEDDGPPSLRFAEATSSVTETDGTASIAVILSNASTEVVTAEVTLTGGTATDGTDFTFTSPTTLTFNPGTITQTVTVAITDDTEYELAETATFELQNPSASASGIATPTTHELTINDDDGPTVEFSVPTATVSEAVGAFGVTLTLDQQVITGTTATISVTISGTATNGEDYTTPPFPVTFASTDGVSKTVSILVTNDKLDEADETIVLTLNVPTGENLKLGPNASTTITITDDDTTPVAVDDPYSTDEDVTLTIAAPGVLINDSDADGDPITTTLVTAPTTGTLTLNSDGGFTFVPPANYSGTVSFVYGASDGVNNSNNATVTITVNPVNDPPVAVDDVLLLSTNAGTTPVDVLANDSDVDGDTLTITSVTQGASGTVAITGDEVTYTPGANFEGEDSFTYTIEDGNGGTATATVTVSLANFGLYLPLIANAPTTAPAQADLVASLKVVPTAPTAGASTQIEVAVTNQGTAPASNFWVDFHINPLRVPLVNDPWNEICNPDACYGIAWFVAGPVAPGASVTLNSQPLSRNNPGGYFEANTTWPGSFVDAGTTILYAYVDSWNRDTSGGVRDPNGAVRESNEDNNKAQQTITVAPGAAPAIQQRTLSPRSLNP